MSKTGAKMSEGKENKDKIILDLCGGTGAWSRPYKENGYDVRLITLPDYDVLTYVPPDNVYGILAAPPCTHFSFARTKANTPRDLLKAMKTVRACLNIIWSCQEQKQDTKHKFTSLKFWALENPARGLLPRFIGKPFYTFHPYDFGDNYKKHTALWGFFNIPVKNPIECTKPKFDKLKTKEIHGQWYGELTRTERRAITPEKFAQAFFNANR